jgi:hypothetical protein
MARLSARCPMVTAAVEYPAAIAASACRTSSAVSSRSLRGRAGRRRPAGRCSGRSRPAASCQDVGTCRRETGGLWPRDVRGAVLVEWMLPGGHGSADPGLGMNRAPDRLYQRSWLSGVCAGCGLADNDVACFPSGPGGAVPGTGPRADGPGRFSALTGDRQLRLP